VTPGIDVAGMTIIQSGLHDGEQVVIDGQSRLTPGARVTIIRSGADTARSRQLVRGAGGGGGYGATAAGGVNHARTDPAPNHAQRPQVTP